MAEATLQRLQAWVHRKSKIVKNGNLINKEEVVES